MRAPVEFLVPGQRRAPFRLTATMPNGKTRIHLHVPVKGKRVRMPVQGPFRAHVEQLLDLGAILIPGGGKLPPAEPPKDKSKKEAPVKADPPKGA